MSETPNDTTQAPGPQPDPQEAFAQLHELFGVLNPPERLELQDALGNAYQGAAVLPARAQIVVMQQLATLWDADVRVPDMSDMSSVAGVLVGMGANPRVLDGLCDAFAAAQPSVLAQAREAAKVAGLTASHPADLFPIEEIVAGLIPFFVRFAARAADLIGQVTSPT